MKFYWHTFLLALPLSVALVGNTASADVPRPSVPEAVKGEQCVEDTDFMRKNHMDLLQHQRDETMHKGIRTKKHSLKECFTCHIVKDADNKPVTVKNPKHFCRECHDYAAVKVDCFQCHTSVPGEDPAYNSGSRETGGSL